MTDTIIPNREILPHFELHKPVATALGAVARLAASLRLEGDAARHFVDAAQQDIEDAIMGLTEDAELRVLSDEQKEQLAASHAPAAVSRVIEAFSGVAAHFSLDESFVQGRTLNVAKSINDVFGDAGPVVELPESYVEREISLKSDDIEQYPLTTDAPALEEEVIIAESDEPDSKAVPHEAKENPQEQGLQREFMAGQMRALRALRGKPLDTRFLSVENEEKRACFGHENVFAGEEADARKAKAFCRECPFAVECLRYAVLKPVGTLVYGATTGRERSKIRQEIHS